jgi:hypothetical protein
VPGYRLTSGKGSPPGGGPRSAALRMPASGPPSNEWTGGNACAKLALIRSGRKRYGGVRDRSGRSATGNGWSSKGRGSATRIPGRTDIGCTPVASVLNRRSAGTSLAPVRPTAPRLKPNWKKSDRFSTGASQRGNCGAGSEECRSSGDPDAGLLPHRANPFPVGDASTRLPAVRSGTACPQRAGRGIGFAEVRGRPHPPLSRAGCGVFSPSPSLAFMGSCPLAQGQSPAVGRGSPAIRKGHLSASVSRLESPSAGLETNPGRRRTPMRLSTPQ